MKQIILLFISVLISGPALSSSPSFDPKRLSDHVKILASDEFEGRGPATPGETKTVAYVIEQMKAVGLQPGGDLKDGKRSWTQAVPLVRSEVKGTPSFMLTVGDKQQNLTQGEQIAVNPPMDGSTSVSIKDIPLVFVGYGIKAPERRWDDFKSMDVKGKMILVLINDPDFETGKGDFEGKAMTYYGRWTYKYEEAARLGALGVLIVHETEPASYGWATVKNSNTEASFDIVRANPGAVHPKIEGWVQRDFTVELFKRSGLDFEILKKQAQTREFKPVVLKDVKFSANYNADVQKITSQNIAGRIEGSKRPEETIIYSAHWDHLGVGAPDAKGDRIYNGAVDNATGTAALIEMARAFATQPKPERSIVFLNVTAEEQGLLGSEYYSDNPLYPLEKTVAVINTDALDPNGPARNFTTSGSNKSDLLDLLIAEGKKMKLAYATDPHPEAGHFFRSDHFSFAKRGVPAISFGSGNDLVNGGVAAGEAEEKAYVANRYHQPADEWQANWTFAGMTHDLQMLYKLGADLANSKQWPQWAKESEFRALREKSAKERK